MGTFHHHADELHGHTVVIRGTDGKVYAGRYDVATDAGILLRNGDIFDPAEAKDGQTATDWIARAAQMGVWPRNPTLLVAEDLVDSMTKLGDLVG